MTENRVAAIVFFDVDHTLIPETSTEWQLLLGLLRRGDVPFSALVRSGWRFIRHPSELTGERLRRNKSYFAGIREDVFARNATQIFQTRIAGRISSQGRDEIAQLKAGGHRVVLLSAGPTILTRLVQTAVNADDTLGADFEVVRGRLTGRLTNKLPYGKGKIEAAVRYAHEHRVPLSNCVAYANATSDLPLLKMVGNPIAINASATVRRVAALRGWPTRQFRH